MLESSQVVRQRSVKAPSAGSIPASPATFSSSEWLDILFMDFWLPPTSIHSETEYELLLDRIATEMAS